MIQREPKYYVTGYEGKDPCRAPFYLRALIFDGKEGDLNTDYVNTFNRLLEENEDFADYKLIADTAIERPPRKIIVINASHDDLPTSYETARIFEDFCNEKGWPVHATVVNTHDELMTEVNKDPENTLIMSQCVDKNTYNIEIAKELEEKGAIIVPGEMTAPGSVFSDKDGTYQLLSDNGKDWGKVARYKKVPVDNKKVEDVVEGILETVDELEAKTKDDTFFIKPHEGGGGLGGFRITKTGEDYIIPDLSKVSGDITEIHPTYIDFDTSNDAKIRELLWIYRLFSSDEKMTSSYLLVDLPIEGADDAAAMQILKDYLHGCEEKRERKLEKMLLSRTQAKKKLVSAIKVFEEKFDRKYTPLVNEHIDFGLWGLRAHYRLSSKGPKLETIYYRIFQLGFTEEGIGYMGADNISNKQTGELEILRLGPLNKVLVDAIGGKEALFKTLTKGAEAVAALAKIEPEKEKNRIPIRLQLDLAAVSRRIGEGNADTARGLCLASRWPEFVHNAREWLEDSFTYYTWKKGSVFSARP